VYRTLSAYGRSPVLQLQCYTQSKADPTSIGGVRFETAGWCYLVRASVTLPVVAVTVGVRSAAVVTVTITGVAD
jgi:phosphomannomutase